MKTRTAIALIIICFLVPFTIALALSYSVQNLSPPISAVISTDSSNMIEPPASAVISTDSNNMIEPSTSAVISTDSKNMVEPLLSAFLSTNTNKLYSLMTVEVRYSYRVAGTQTGWLETYPSANSTAIYRNQSIYIKIKVNDSAASADQHDVRISIYSKATSTWLCRNKSIPYEGYGYFSTVEKYDWQVGYYLLQVMAVRKSNGYVCIKNFDDFFKVVVPPAPPAIAVAPTPNLTIMNQTNITKTNITNITKMNITMKMPSQPPSGGGGGGGGPVASVAQIVQQVFRKAIVNFTNPHGIAGAFSQAQPGSSMDRDNVRIIFLGKDRVIYENKECTRFRFRIEEIGGIPTIAMLEFTNLSASTTKAVLSDSSRVDVLEGSAVVRVALLPYESVELDIYTPDGPEGSYLAQILRYMQSPAFWDQTVGFLPIWLIILSILGLLAYAMVRTTKRRTFTYRYR